MCIRDSIAVRAVSSSTCGGWVGVDTSGLDYGVACGASCGGACISKFDSTSGAVFASVNHHGHMNWSYVGKCPFIDLCGVADGGLVDLLIDNLCYHWCRYLCVHCYNTN